tara:strand:- start:254 stop:607 length:354 start_codon:yes stop_codon:yes gene_type:complete
MLRSPKSTQRKMRQLELIIKEASGVLSVEGPAKNQVKGSVSQNSGTISIELKQPFAAEPILIASSTVDEGDVKIKSGNKGGSSDKLEIINILAGAAGDLDEGEIHLLVIGSDVTEQY